VAFVGENGAGKSTLAKLIAGLYPPNKGKVLLDEIDLQEWDRDYLYSHLSLIFQNFVHFEATAADNIAYGNWRHLLGKHEEIERIARRTNVHELIKTMPQGYETKLGRFFSDYMPSGGQWQHLAVARAFARDGAVLILDEPTSNLGARAEYDLFCRFRHLANGRTTILISHRFSTVSMADWIVMLDEGRMVEAGTHKKLLENDGAYAGLYRLHQQQMGEIEKSSKHER
jgi:ATP-binding cassette subfamily B protein